MKSERFIHIDSYENGNHVVPASPIFAREGDILVSSQYKDINHQYLNYLSSLVSINGDSVFPSLKNLTLLEPSGDGRTTAQKTLKDFCLIGKLRQLVINDGLAGLQSFAIASEMYPEDDSLMKLAKEIGLPLVSGSHEFFIALGTKSVTRKIFKDLGLKVPDGVENITEGQIDKLLANPQLLSSQDVWIKADWGAFGLRNIYVAPIAIDAAREQFTKVSSTYQGNYVIERHIQNAVSFPGVLMKIDNSCVCIQDIHEQLGVLGSTVYKPDEEDRKFFAKNPFLGPPFWWDDAGLKSKFEKEARMIGSKLFDIGWRGNICVDAIIDSSKNIYWDEVNYRSGGSTLVIEAIRKLYNSDEGACLEDMGVAFSVRHLRIGELTFGKLLNRLHRDLDLWTNEMNLVILNADFYEKRGFDLVAFGKNVTNDKLASLLDMAEKKIRG